jgi:hypothetical protein
VAGPKILAFVSESPEGVNRKAHRDFRREIGGSTFGESLFPCTPSPFCLTIRTEARDVASQMVLCVLMCKFMI